MSEIGSDIEKAANLLLNREVVAIPTETVYGLAGNAIDLKAITRIFEIKNRPSFDPLIVHIDSVERIEQVMNTPNPALLKLLQYFSPGPLTIVGKKQKGIPDLVTSGKDTVAVRIPNHPLTLSLLRMLPFPLAAPSANPFTYVSPTSALHVSEQLGSKIPYILDGGKCQVGVESTIVRFVNDQIEILRHGGLPFELLEKVSGLPVVFPAMGHNEAIPGNFKKHYSTLTPFKLGRPSSEEIKDDIGFIGFEKPLTGLRSENQLLLSATGDLNEAAQNVFNHLRTMDQRGFTRLYAELVPEIGIGRAINDRLRRAENS